MKIKILCFIFLGIISTSMAQWTKTNLPSYAWSLAASGDTLYAGTLSNGVYRSIGGNGWTEINNGITIKEVWAIAVLGKSVFAGTKSGGIFKSLDNGNTWILSNTGIPSTTIIRAFAQFGTKIFATTNNSGIYVSLDNGSSWTQHNSGISGLVARPLLTTETDLFVGVGTRVYKYDSANSKWLLASTGIPNNTVSSIAYMKSNKNLFAGISSSINEVARSEDNGNNWVLSDNGLPKVPVDALATIGTNIFAGNDYGVYLSTNFGISWSNVSDGMAIASYCTFLTPGKTDLFVIYMGDVWKRPYNGMITSVKQTDNEIPSSFMLRQNYPNPFNPSTTISFSIPQVMVRQAHHDNADVIPSLSRDEVHVTLKVYDVLGREVATLVNDNLGAGSYSYNFDASKLTSGVYLYKLQAGKYSETKKMILMK
jgi:hypothetical protein